MKKFDEDPLGYITDMYCLWFAVIFIPGCLAMMVWVVIMFSGCEAFYSTCIQCDLPIDCHGNQRGSPKYDPNCK
jgi:hypothetical protein